MVAVAPDRPTPVPASADAVPAAPAARRRVAPGAALVLGVAGAAVLASSGSPAWGALRAVVALAGGCALARVQRRGGPRAAGWSGVLVGTVALPASGVLAGDHLAASAVPRGVAAAVAAAAAAVLLVTAAAVLVRATRGWWRLLAVPVALALLQLVAGPVALAVLTTNRAPATPAGATPADHGLEHVDVTVTTRDGTDLAAWYVPGRSGAAVLLLHGSGSSRSATLDHAEVLAGLGYGVLMVDARGHGRSGGTPMALGWHGGDDLVAAVDWLAERPDAEAGRIGAVGLSMGGEEALTLAARDVRVRVVVAEGVGVRVARDARSPGWFPDLVNRWTYALTDVLTAASPPVPLRAAVGRLGDGQHALLIAGAGEGEQADWYAGAAPDRVEVWHVPDAAHTAALDEHPDEWSERVAALLAAGLRS